MQKNCLSVQFLQLIHSRTPGGGLVGGGEPNENRYDNFKPLSVGDFEGSFRKVKQSEHLLTSEELTFLQIAQVQFFAASPLDFSTN